MSTLNWRRWSVLVVSLYLNSASRILSSLVVISQTKFTNAKDVARPSIGVGGVTLLLYSSWTLNMTHLIRAARLTVQEGTL